MLNKKFIYFVTLIVSESDNVNRNKKKPFIFMLNAFAIAQNDLSEGSFH